jgi:hypothetical protein
MKTKLSKSTVCGALLAIVLTATGYSATNSYLDYIEQIHSSQRSIAECDRMLQIENLNELQIQARNESGQQALQGLDHLVDANITSIKVQLTSFDAQTQSFAKAVLKHIAHRRSQADSMNAALSANN